MVAGGLIINNRSVPLTPLSEMPRVLEAVVPRTRNKDQITFLMTSQYHTVLPLNCMSPPVPHLESSKPLRIIGLLFVPLYQAITACLLIWLLPPKSIQVIGKNAKQLIIAHVNWRLTDSASHFKARTVSVHRDFLTGQLVMGLRFKPKSVTRSQGEIKDSRSIHTPLVMWERSCVSSNIPEDLGEKG